MEVRDLERDRMEMNGGMSMNGMGLGGERWNGIELN